MRLLMLVCLGGAIGAGTRHMIGVWFFARGLTAFPWATLLINVTGSALMGVAIGLLATRTIPSPELRAFIATGILGGYTTFSTFSLDAWQLIERDQMLAAGAYMLGSVAVSLLALVAGLATVRLVMS